MERTRELSSTNNGGLEWNYTGDGTVDRNGNPAIKSKSGGWGPGTLLLVSQGLSNLALYGVGVNLVQFMTQVLQQDNAGAASNVTNWNGTTYLFSLVGAFISDIYWGRYKTCAVFQTIFAVGLMVLTGSTYLFMHKVCSPSTNTDCGAPSNAQITVFYVTIYLIALGNGGFMPSITTFGADQFDEEDPKERPSKVAFFSYFYVVTNVGTLFSNTGLVYLEDRGKWLLAYGLSAGASVLSLSLFFLGIPRYRHFKPAGNPLIKFLQVVIASWRKMKAKVPDNKDELFELDMVEENNSGRKIAHTNGFKFLDKAAVITEEDTRQDSETERNPWHLCPVTQVEEVKCILRLIPLWLCSIMYSVGYTQMNTLFVEQADSMDTHFYGFNIPSASINIFEIVGVTSFVYIYSALVVPLSRKINKKNPDGLTELQRMGIGLLVSAVSMVVAGVVEHERRKHSAFGDDGEPSSRVSVLWQIPQYYLIGVSEVFMYVCQLEFFNDQAPEGLRTFGSSMYLTSIALGNYVSSLLVTIVSDCTKATGRSEWIPENLNEGHLDLFFYLIAGLIMVDFVLYVACAKWYKYVKWE